MNWKKFRHQLFRISFGLLLVIYFLFVTIYGFLFIGPAPQSTKVEDATWGVNFSHRQAEALGLNWQETFLALADDLGAQYWRIPVYWDELEKTKDEYDFTKWDWQIAELEKRDAKVILAIGVKLPRWPECHLPDWVKDANRATHEQQLFQYLREVVARYRDSEAVLMWQVENEPFLYPFGECPRPDGELLDKEIQLVKVLDKKNTLGVQHPIMITDSGELSVWLPAGKRADVFGSTLYRIVHDPRIGFLEYTFFTPTFHARKEVFLHWFYPNLEVQVIELQAEPWVTSLPLSLENLEEQNKTLSPEQFDKNIQFALATGTKTFYLWGAEWWYWLKSAQDMPDRYKPRGL